MTPDRPALSRYRLELEQRYADRFPRSKSYYAGSRAVLDHTSHAIRWNDPFMPLVTRATGPTIEDLDGHRILDYWQGHFTNLMGHNPSLIRDALAGALNDGRGLQTGMVHEIEEEVADLIRTCTGCETVRLTTSGSLGTFYAVLLSRAHTGRDTVVKVAGGWHGSQPFALKGVSAVGTSFDHMESEGLSADAQAEIRVTRFNDPEDLARTFAAAGDRIACMLIEPVLGSGGGMAATAEYLREARRLTTEHGALLVSDEIITGFRFRAGDLTRLYGVQPDLIVLGKVLGGGMPVAAVGGRRDVLELCTRASGRVKFEGGTYSAHELSLIAARTIVRHLMEHEDEIYPRLAELGAHMRDGLGRAADEAGLPLFLMGGPSDAVSGGSLVSVHAAAEPGPPPTCPEALAETRHPLIRERLIKSALLLRDVSSRNGLGAISTAHSKADLDRTIEAYREAFREFREAGLAG